jgi:type II secretory pathway pseudopilin PulG
MKGAGSEDGYTLIELLVATVLLMVVTGAFFQVLMSGLRGSQTARSVSSISQEARLGLNRMIRDTREAVLIEGPSDTQPATDQSYRIKLDFNGDELYQNPNAAGDYEIETFAYVPADKVITLNGETLVSGVEAVPGKDVFSYSSNALAYDWGNDGVTSAADLDEAPSHGITDVGNANGELDDPELSFISDVSFALRLTDGDRWTNYYGQAQLRNRR